MGFFFEPFYPLEPEFRFILVDTLFDEILPVADAIDQSSEVMGDGDDCFGSAKSGFETTVFCAERTLAMGQALSAQAQGVGSSIVDFARGSTQYLTSADGVVWK